ncbi:MAG TPA: hypothetical protein VGO56_10280 [Pyrinomonadaceae bacterium]|jgi:hypothetical protein|nr:hypothetical protein [Pyrinomonadaceae bacterium]
MKIFAFRKYSRFSLGILAVVMALGLGFAPKRMAQNPEPMSKFTFTEGDRETAMKITVASGRITKVSATRGRDSFSFKPLKAGERPKRTGRAGQILLCAKLKPTDTSRWTFCSYIAGPQGSDTATRRRFSDDIQLESFSWGEAGGPDGGGGTDPGDGGGSGGSSNCWEDQELQMSICDP